VIGCVTLHGAEPSRQPEFAAGPQIDQPTGFFHTDVARIVAVREDRRATVVDMELSSEGNTFWVDAKGRHRADMRYQVGGIFRRY